MIFVTAENKAIFDNLGTMLVKAARTQLEKDGRRATGKSIQSLESKVQALGDDVAIQLIGEDYLEYQDTGRKPGTMPPVDALIKWVKIKGIESDTKKAKGVAFAIAKNMQKIGMHSKNKRLDLSQRNFLGRAADNFTPQMDEGLFRAFEKKFNLIVDKFAKDIRNGTNN